MEERMCLSYVLKLIKTKNKCRFNSLDMDNILFGTGAILSSGRNKIIDFVNFIAQQ
jgi:hypothetical protein